MSIESTWFKYASNGKTDKLITHLNLSSNTAQKQVFLHLRDKKGRQALHLAAKGGHLSTLSHLIKLGALVES